MTEKPTDASKRRERSTVNSGDYDRILSEFCRRIVRMKESTQAYDNSFTRPNCEPGHITVTFEIKGGFGSADELFSALRVAGGYCLPRKD